MTKADIDSSLNADEAAGAVCRWEVYAIALGRVVSVTGWPEATAGERLRQAAVDYRIRVRFAPTWLPRTPNDLRREGARHAYPDKVLDGGDTGGCEWCTPIDDFLAIGPPAMAEYRMQFTEWDDDDLSAELEELRKA